MGKLNIGHLAKEEAPIGHLANRDDVQLGVQVSPPGQAKIIRKDEDNGQGIGQVDQNGQRKAEKQIELASLPGVLKKGPLHIGNAKINCFVLDEPQNRRLLSGRSVTNAVGLSGRGQGMDRFLNSASLQPFITEKLCKALEEPVHFLVTKGLVPASGYEAWVMPEICYVIIDAAEAGVLHPSLAKTVAQAKMLVRGFSTVGIIALVDEATGFQEIRDRRALQEILAKYISPDALEWQKTFQDEFYEQLFRLRGWQWRPMSAKRPKLVAKLTINIIYQRLAPGVYEALNALTPRNEKGRLKHHLHRHLTPEEGRVALERHFHQVDALMKASNNWDTFKRLLERALPKHNATPMLPNIDWDSTDDTDKE